MHPAQFGGDASLVPHARTACRCTRSNKLSELVPPPGDPDASHVLLAGTSQLESEE
jgi:hypothetical protein